MCVCVCVCVCVYVCMYVLTIQLVAPQSIISATSDIKANNIDDVRVGHGWCVGDGEKIHRQVGASRIWPKPMER